MQTTLVQEYETALAAILPSQMQALLVPPPVHPLEFPLFAQNSIAVDVLRCDLLHPVISGNKWYKLKFNLLQAHFSGYQHLLSFGGAWSNHLHALAYCAHELGLRSTGVVRGDELAPSSNAMLQDAHRWEMNLRFVSRAQYRELTCAPTEYEADSWVIPEGGDNCLGVLGCATLIPLHLLDQYDVVVLPWGTGCTAMGVRLALPSHATVWAVSALKGEWLSKALQLRLQYWGYQNQGHMEIVNDAHFGGYGRVTEELLSYIVDFSDNTGLPLDPVYSGKAIYALCQRIRQNELPAHSRVLFIHTGGMQGVRGFQSLTG